MKLYNKIYNAHTLLYALFIIAFLVLSCFENNNGQNQVNQASEDESLKKSTNNKIVFKNYQVTDRQILKLGHCINTSANEYFPVVSADGRTLIFSGMDRTGFFDFKLDFTKQKSSGGEDVFISTMTNGIWADARPISAINTDGHEVVSQLLLDGSMMVSGNYSEKLGPKDLNNGTETTDIFLMKKTSEGFAVNHFPEPVNSIYSEFDAIISEGESYVIFASDRPGCEGGYHKKGWVWNNSFWGNSDIFVSTKKGDFWQEPISLGSLVNSSGAERSPWLSKDGLTLFVSSNGYNSERSDMEIYAFHRSNKNEWTSWKGPELVSDCNSLLDDWGYIEDQNGVAYFSRATALGFKPTQGGSGGDGGIRETNFRTGYSVHGLQVGSCISENTVDVFMAKSKGNPLFILDDSFFKFNSSEIEKTFEKKLIALVDYLNQNENYKVKITGFTDNVGGEQYNLDLSLRRAESVKKFLMKNNCKCLIDIEGKGETTPKYDNDVEKSRSKNRRVEIHLF
jgi:outer membrane protein OmpA-like peptidoglycan-associated protein